MKNSLLKEGNRPLFIIHTNNDRVSQKKSQEFLIFFHFECMDFRVLFSEKKRIIFPLLHWIIMVTHIFRLRNKKWVPKKKIVRYYPSSFRLSMCMCILIIISFLLKILTEWNMRITTTTTATKQRIFFVLYFKNDIIIIIINNIIQDNKKSNLSHHFTYSLNSYWKCFLNK